MGRISRKLAALAVVLIAVPVVSTLGSSTARACSCAAVDPVDAVAMADVVFTGTVVSNEGSDNEPVWSFEVDGVVKGAVSSVEVVAGEDWAGGCGTDFSRFNESVVVYAARNGDRLQAMGCMPSPTADAFAAQLAAVSKPTGTGPPAAVMVGTYGSSDVAVLDEAGRTIGRSHLGLAGGAVAHCAGTSLVAVVPTDQSDSMSIVDLATMTVLEQRPLRSGFVSVTGDGVECFDGGRLVVSSAGYGPNEGSIVVAATSSEDGVPSDVRRTLDGVSRAVIHPAGTVMLLPTSVNDPIRVLGAEALEPLDVDVVLPAGASTIDGALSPDGSRLAVLATLSGQAVQFDTGATHVIVLDVVDGIPISDGVEVLPLIEPGDDIESASGAAKWIRWADADTWFIESETVSTKKGQFIGTDGVTLLGPTDIGWGWGLVPLDGSMLRVRNGGLEIVGRDGAAVDGGPAPPSEYVDRTLALDGLVDAPTFDVLTMNTDALSIRPVDSVEVGTDTTPSESSALAPAESEPMLDTNSQPSPAEPDQTGGSTPNDEGGGSWPWLLGAGLLAGALLIGSVALSRRRRALSLVGREPTIV